MLGWSIAELRGRLSLTRDVHAADDLSAADKLNAQLWRGSQWRIWFDRVSWLHADLKIAGPPKDGRYDPGGQRPPYAYVKTPDGRDIADKGIIPSADISNVQDNFTLREAVRRTVNCLDLLWLEPDLMVNNDQLRADKQFLEDTIRKPSASADQDKHDPIVRVRHDALVLLDLWSGYLREQLANNAVDRETATLLVAFQCGQAMSFLSWNVTSRTLDAEAPVDAVDASTQPHPRANATESHVSAFHKAFDDRTVGYLLHQLAILGSSLGDGDARTMKLIIRSLKLWKRAVDWLELATERDDPVLQKTSPFDRELRIALVDQTNIWQALILNEEKLEAFTTPGLTNGMRMQVARLLANAITPRQIGDLELSVVSKAEVVLKPLEAQVVAEINTISTKVTTPLVTLGENVLRKSLPAIIIIGGVVALLLVLSAVLVTQLGGSPLQTALNGIGALVLGGAGWFQVTKVSQQQNDAANQAVHNAVSSVKGEVQTAANSAGTKVSGAIGAVQQSVASVAQTAQTEIQNTAKFASDIVHTAVAKAQEGSERALSELDDDLHEQENVLAITHPLLDYVTSRTHRAAAQGVSAQSLSATFLTTVLWTEQDNEGELCKVAYAAFGITGLAAISTGIPPETDVPGLPQANPPAPQPAQPATLANGSVHVEAAAAG